MIANHDDRVGEDTARAAGERDRSADFISDVEGERTQKVCDTVPR
jgi:hypothetical protein